MISKIQLCNPEIGFQLSGVAEALLFYKWLYWKNGISAREFRHEWERDVFDIMQIDGAVNQKELREAQINKLISKVRY